MLKTSKINSPKQENNGWHKRDSFIHSLFKNRQLLKCFILAETFDYQNLPPCLPFLLPNGAVDFLQLSTPFMCLGGGCCIYKPRGRSWLSNPFMFIHSFYYEFVSGIGIRSILGSEILSEVSRKLPGKLFLLLERSTIRNLLETSKEADL